MQNNNIVYKSTSEFLQFINKKKKESGNPNALTKFDKRTSNTSKGKTNKSKPSYNF